MTLQQACSMAHIHCLYTQSPQNAIQSQQTDKVGNNGIVEIYDVKSYQIESNVVMEFQFWIDGNLKLNQSVKCGLSKWIHKDFIRAFWISQYTDILF